MERESQKKGHGGRKPKFDYTSKDFLSSVESYAKKGFTDKEIAFAIGMNPTLNPILNSLKFETIRVKQLSN